MHVIGHDDISQRGGVSVDGFGVQCPHGSARCGWIGEDRSPPSDDHGEQVSVVRQRSPAFAQVSTVRGLGG
jgi:hypothetical protein